ncbi:MAG TPA: hypothetical protein VLW17_00735, partial [Thermoanaerobaculaceae bacterium]|nr:hypothetical protein [Thermoanaerobaculaceae bacterium]
MNGRVRRRTRAPRDGAAVRVPVGAGRKSAAALAAVAIVAVAAFPGRSDACSACGCTLSSDWAA